MASETSFQLSWVHSRFSISVAMQMFLVACSFRPSVCRRNGRRDESGWAIMMIVIMRRAEGKGLSGSLSTIWENVFYERWCLRLAKCMHICIYIRTRKGSKIMRPEKQVQEEDDDDGVPTDIWKNERVEAETSSSVNLLKEKEGKGMNQKGPTDCLGADMMRFQTAFSLRDEGRERIRLHDDPVFLFSQQLMLVVVVVVEFAACVMSLTTFFFAACTASPEERTGSTGLDLASFKKRERKQRERETGLRVKKERRERERTDRRRRGPEKYSWRQREWVELRGGRLLLTSYPLRPLFL